MGQDMTNRMFLGWNYNATPANAYISLGSVGTQTLALQPNGGNTSFGGGIIVKYSSKSASYTISSTDYLVAFTSSGSIATLPTSSVATGQMFIIKNEGFGSVTVSPVVDGTTMTLSAKGVARVYWNGSAWFSW